MDDVGIVSDETIKAWVDEEKAIAKAPFRVVKTDGRSASLEAKGCLSVASQIVEERRPDAPGMAVYGD